MNHSILLVQLSNFAQWEVPAVYVFWAVIAHICISMLLSLVLLKAMTKRQRGFRLQSYFLFLSLQFCIPILGHLIAFILVYMIKKSKSKMQNDSFGLYSLPQYEVHHAAKPKQSNPQGVYYKLVSDAAPTNVRFKALGVVSQLSPKVSVPILKQILDDKADDVRLVAYSLIDSEEKRISKEIYVALGEFEGAKDSETRARLAKKLSECYWDLVYIGLVDGDVKRFALLESDKYARMANEILKNDRMVLMLIGKVNLSLGRYDEAKAAFEKAIESGMANDRVLPYMAEIAFASRDFAKVREYFSGGEKAFGSMMSIWQIAKYWGGKKIES